MGLLVILDVILDAMRVLISKRTDGSGVLRCIRDDGSETWAKQTDRQAAFFALHDLTHFAVETTLGTRDGFFGLLAQGWDITETDGKSSRGRLPWEVIEVEQMVGLFDSERACGQQWSDAQWNESLTRYAAEAQVTPRRLTPDQAAAIRNRRAELFRQWAAVQPGETLELEFRAASAAGLPIERGPRSSRRDTSR